MKWIDGLLDIFFPQRCASCDKQLHAKESLICIDCLMAMPRTNYHTDPCNEMAQRFWGKIELQHATALFHFDKHEGYRRVIHQLKYNNQPQLARFLGQIAAQDASTSGFFDTIDALIPVPLHPSRQRKRGFNQSHHIAQGIQAQTAIPILDKVVRRTVNNRTQTRIERSQRWQNVNNIFALSHSYNIDNRHILLIDDVCTSGSTLEAIAQIIQKKYENIRISVLTLAVAPFHLPVK